jgi:hypothetical protein
MKIFKKANVNRYSQIELGENSASNEFHVYKTMYDDGYDGFHLLLISARNEEEAESVQRDYLSKEYRITEREFSYPELYPALATRTNAPGVIFDNHDVRMGR